MKTWMRGWIVGLVAVSNVVWTADIVRADEPVDAEMRAEISRLKQRLSALEAKLEAQGARAVGAQAGAAVLQMPGGLHGVQMSGFVDTSFTYNLNEPNDRVNDVRVFDTQANSFVVNNAQLNIEKGTDHSSPLGFKLALMFGDDAESTHSTGFFTGTDSLDIQQAYVSYLAPVGEGLDISFGKMATLIGAEVIESVDNWNFSRAYLFGFAIPFTHTGVRMSYPLSETLTFTTGVNNGWDNADDDNIGKGIEWQLAWALSDDLSVAYNGMFSSEVVNAANEDRWITDIVASYQATDKLALMLNFDFGFQDDAIAIGQSAYWTGIAGYAKYDVNDRWSLAGRYEFFSDEDSFRTGVGVGDVEFQEFTLTSEHKLRDNLIARLEYRHDQADSAVFDTDKGTRQNNQDTIALEFILPF